MTESHRYRDRTDAGRRLAGVLTEVLPEPGAAVVLALPRGGLPVAAEISSALGLPLDVLIVRKLGLPFQPELAMGAIASGGSRVLNRDVIAISGVGEAAIAAVEEHERAELRRREEMYRGDRPFPPLEGRTVILVDDGVATGSTIQAAIRAVRSHGPDRIVVAVPVGSPDVIRDLGEEADLVVCPLTPEGFFAIGSWYEDFEQIGDDRVRDVLSGAWADQDA